MKRVVRGVGGSELRKGGWGERGKVIKHRKGGGGD